LLCWDDGYDEDDGKEILLTDDHAAEKTHGKILLSMLLLAMSHGQVAAKPIQSLQLVQTVKLPLVKGALIS
jgi:hypothetical protein